MKNQIPGSPESFGMSLFLSYLWFFIAYRRFSALAFLLPAIAFAICLLFIYSAYSSGEKARILFARMAITIAVFAPILVWAIIMD